MRARFSSAEALLVVVTAAWGLNYTAFKYALTHGFHPLVSIGLRWTLAGAAFALITLALGKGGGLRRRDVVRIGLLGLLGIGACQVAYAYGLELAPASTVAIVFGLLPVAMAVVATLFGVERLHARHWLGVAVSALGVGLIGASRGELGGGVVGVLLAAFAVSAFGAYSVGLFPLSRRVSPTALNAVSICTAVPVLLAIASPALAGQDWSEPNPLAWGALVYSALGSVVVGNGLWFYAQRRVGPGRAGIYGNLQPVFGAMFAVLLLSEVLDGLEIAGAVAIGAGILLARTSRPPVQPEP